MAMKKTLTLLVLSLFSTLTFAQTDIKPTIEPSFFAANDEIAITFNVTGTALQSLDEAWLWMWVPGKGDAPSNINPASSNSALTDAAKFTRTTSNTGAVSFSITLVPSDFTGIAAEDISELGIILKGNDWANGQTSDYIATISDGFTLVMENPTGNYGFYESSQEIAITAKTSETAFIDIQVDDISIQTANDATELTTNHIIINDGEVHIIKAIATNGTETQSVSYSYSNTPTPTEQPLPAGLQDGINYQSNTSLTLALRAPNKDHVFVIGDFNDWSLDTDYLMKKDGEVFWLEIQNLSEGVEYHYQYLVDGTIKIADPYTEKIASPFDDPQIIDENRYPNLKPYPSSETTEAVSIFQTNRSEFEWSNFARPEKEDLIIYELLIRDFTEERTYDAVTARLDYLEALGINALELMPVQEFEGNISWGYNPSSMLAVDKYYGTELSLKTLIDEAHKRGMAVILDIVLNHQFGRNSLVRLYNEGLYGNPTSENPWFNTAAKHDFNVGYDMNHESQYTKDYVDRVVTYWLDEYNIDGYRFDLSKGFTQRNSIGNLGLWGSYDASRIALLKRMSDVIWNNDPTAYVILEHFADNREEQELADYGMMLWGNVHGKYISAGKGSSVTLAELYHENRGWNNPHLVGYMESHDEERFMWELTKSGSTSTDDALERAKLVTSFFLTVPGPKMIWQFGEFGYDLQLNNDRLGIKPTRWEYLEDPNRKELFDLYTSLINLRTKTEYIDKAYFEWNTNGRIKTINITHPDVHIYVVGNFDDETQTSTHQFTKTGTWYNYFTGASFEVTDQNNEYSLPGGVFQIYTSELIDNYIDDQRLTLGVDLEEKTSITVYPNPTSDYVQFEGTSREWSYSITDITGKIIDAGLGAHDDRVNFSMLPSGIYHLTITSTDGRTDRHQIIKK